jgi:hypothetical protein
MRVDVDGTWYFTSLLLLRLKTHFHWLRVALQNELLNDYKAI